MSHPFCSHEFDERLRAAARAFLGDEYVPSFAAPEPPTAPAAEVPQLTWRAKEAPARGQGIDVKAIFSSYLQEQSAPEMARLNRELVQQLGRLNAVDPAVQAFNQGEFSLYALDGTRVLTTGGAPTVQRNRLVELFMGRTTVYAPERLVAGHLVVGLSQWDAPQFPVGHPFRVYRVYRTPVSGDSVLLLEIVTNR